MHLFRHFRPSCNVSVLESRHSGRGTCFTARARTDKLSHNVSQSLPFLSGVYNGTVTQSEGLLLQLQDVGDDDDCTAKMRSQAGLVVSPARERRQPYPPPLCGLFPSNPTSTRIKHQRLTQTSTISHKLICVPPHLAASHRRPGRSSSHRSGGVACRLCL